MAAKYRHYKVEVREDSDEGSNLEDPRDALNRPFLPDSDGEDGDDVSSDGEDSDDVSSDDDIAFGDFGRVITYSEDDDDEGDDNGEDRYVVAFKSLFTEDETTSEAFYGKIQRKEPVSKQEGEDDGELFPLEDAVEEDRSGGSVSPPAVRAARIGIYYGDKCLHVLIEYRPGIPQIQKLVSYLAQRLEEPGEYNVRQEYKDRQFDRKRVTEVLDTSLDEATMSFVRNPGNCEADELDVTDSLAEATPGDYRATLQISSGRSDIESLTARSALSHVLGVDSDKMADVLTTEAVRGDFESLKIAGEEGGEINFTDNVDSERIDDLGDGYLNDDLGDKLIKKIKERMNVDGPDDSDADSSEATESDDSEDDSDGEGDDTETASDEKAEASEADTTDSDTATDGHPTDGADATEADEDADMADNESDDTDDDNATSEDGDSDAESTTDAPEAADDATEPDQDETANDTTPDDDSDTDVTESGGSEREAESDASADVVRDGEAEVSDDSNAMATDTQTDATSGDGEHDANTGDDPN